MVMCFPKSINKFRVSLVRKFSDFRFNLTKHFKFHARNIREEISTKLSKLLPALLLLLPSLLGGHDDSEDIMSLSRGASKDSNCAKLPLLDPSLTTSSAELKAPVRDWLEFMSASTPSSILPIVPMVDCRLSVDEQFSS